MTMFLIQALLWLLAVFLLGYGISRFLKSLFCRDQVDDIDAYTYNRPTAMPGVDAGRVGAPSRGISATTASALGGVAAAAGAVAVARTKMEEAEFPEVSLKAPRMDADLPDVSLKAPRMDVELPDVGLSAPAMVDLSGIDPHKPIVNPPDLDMELELPKLSLPDIETALPEASLAMPEVDVPDISLEMSEAEVNVPSISLQAHELNPMDADANIPSVAFADEAPSLPEASTDDGGSLLDMAKGAVVAAGAGLAAKAASAMDFSGVDPHKPIVDPPDFDLDLPDMAVKSLGMGVDGIDPHKPIIDPPDLDMELAGLDLPDVEASLPEAAIEIPEIKVGLPDVSVEMPEVAAKADLPDVSLEMPEVEADLPQPSLQAPELSPMEADASIPSVAFADEAPSLPEASTDDGGSLLDMAKGAVVAAGASLAAKAASAMDFSGVDPHKPIVDPPDFDLDLPDMAVKSLGMGVDGIDPHKPIIDPPDLDMELAGLDLPDVEASLPESLPEASTDDGGSLLDMAKGALVAAGAGLAAKAASAMDFSGIDPHKPIIDPPDHTAALPASGWGAGTDAGKSEEDDDDADWLLALVRRTKYEYQGRNPRAVSKVWDAVSSDYDCSALDEYESLTLHPAQYDKLGISHCGVPHAGFVAVGGDVSNIEPGCAVLFHYPNVVVCRDHEDNHHFIRVTG